MPSLTVKLYSILFKFLLKRRLQSLIEASLEPTLHSTHPPSNTYGVVSRTDDSLVAAANPTFSDDGVATKDIHIDPLTSLSLRLFLPDSALVSSVDSPPLFRTRLPKDRSNGEAEKVKEMDNGVYRGYSPKLDGNSRNYRKLPVILQFHGGGWVSGSNTSAANDLFCRRIAKLLDAVVVAVGYRLAPENKYPAPFEDGLKVLNWLAQQANLAECSKSLENRRIAGGVEGRRRQIVDVFGSSMVEPWLAAHADPSRCVLLGVSCGANIANYVTRKAVESGKLLDPVRVVAQVLMYPFFIGNVPTRSEIKLANSYLYDKAMSIIAWKLFLPEEEFSLDHPAANPLIDGREMHLKDMPPTLTIVAEHDWMRDRAIAYSEELRKVNVAAPLLDYKDAVHEFATLDVLLKTPHAQACAEDIAIWVKKYISFRGAEFSY